MEDSIKTCRLTHRALMAATVAILAFFCVPSQSVQYSNSITEVESLQQLKRLFAEYRSEIPKHSTAYSNANHLLLMEELPQGLKLNDYTDKQFFKEYLPPSTNDASVAEIVHYLRSDSSPFYADTSSVESPSFLDTPGELKERAYLILYPVTMSVAENTWSIRAVTDKWGEVLSGALEKRSELSFQDLVLHQIADDELKSQLSKWCEKELPENVKPIWGEIQGRTINSAVTYLSERQKSANESLTVMGFTVRRQIATPTAVIAIFGIQLFLLVHSNILFRIASGSNSRWLSAWSPVCDGWMARTVEFLTCMIGPAAAVYLASRQTYSLLLQITLVLLCLAIGVAISCYSWQSRRSWPAF